MKKFYENPEMELIEITDIIATGDFNDSGDLDDFGKGDGDDIGSLIGGN